MEEGVAGGEGASVPRPLSLPCLQCLSLPPPPLHHWLAARVYFVLNIHWISSQCWRLTQRVRQGPTPPPSLSPYQGNLWIFKTLRARAHTCTPISPHRLLSLPPRPSYLVDKKLSHRRLIQEPYFSMRAGSKSSEHDTHFSKCSLFNTSVWSQHCRQLCADMATVYHSVSWLELLQFALYVLYTSIRSTCFQHISQVSVSHDTYLVFGGKKKMQADFFAKSIIHKIYKLDYQSKQS